MSLVFTRELYLREAKEGDAVELARSIPHDNRLVFKKKAGCSYLSSIREGVTTSSPCAYAMISRGRIAGLFGIVIAANGICDLGYPWLVLGEEIAYCWRPFLRHAPEVMESLGAPFDVIATWVDAENLRHCRFARHLGFSPKRVVEMGPDKHSFVEYVRVM